MTTEQYIDMLLVRPGAPHWATGRLPNGAAYSHECSDVRTCRLQEQIRQMEREREGAR